MGFDGLLGNERLKENLHLSLAKGHTSHFYLISGPTGSGKRTLARLLSAALMCSHGDRPCMQCNACRKVLEDVHPDCITVTDPEHKNVAVKIVRQIREDMFVRPNEAAYKIYLFPQELGIEGQNALLKILEEPPAHGVFILLTDNPDKLLPTVRSRCTELKLQALEGKTIRNQLRLDFPKATEEDIAAAVFRSGSFLGQARELLENGDGLPPQTESFVKAFANRDSLLLTQTLVPMEKWKRDALAEILAQWLELLESALTCRGGLTAVSSHGRELARQRSGVEIYEGVQALKKALEYTQSNVSPAAVCGWLVWVLR
jgi:DNA polymerase-3 subunit delta'